MNKTVKIAVIVIVVLIFLHFARTTFINQQAASAPQG